VVQANVKGGVRTKKRKTADDDRFTAESWSRRFRIWFEGCGMSQTEFSELTGIKQPMISVYLSGERSPSFRTFLKISKVCGSSFLG